MAGIIGEIAQKAQALQGVRLNNEALQQAQERQQREAQGRDALQAYYKSGGQDRDALINGIMNSPELANNVLTGIGIADKRQEEQAVADVARLWQTRSNPESFRGAVAQRIDAVMQRGGNPSDTVQLGMIYEKDPMEAETQLKGIAAALEAKGYKTGVFDVAAGAEPMNAFQAVSTDLRRQELEFNKQQKMAENKLKVIEAKLKAEENELKREQMKAQIQETQADLEKKRQELEQAKKSKESGKLLVADAYNEVKSLLSSPDLDDAIGTFETSMPTVFGSTQDVINKASRLQSLLTVDNLKLMSGVLTDKDIQFLTNVASGLNVTEGGIKGSKEGVRMRLQQIKERIESAAKQQGIDISAGLDSGDSDEEDQAQVVEWSSL